MKIALTQFDIKWEDKEYNKINAERLVREASENKAELIIFPEMTLTGFTMNLSLGEKMDKSDTLEFFKNLSKKYNIAIVFGMISGNYNKAIMVDKDEILLNYNKIHPFSFGEENKYFDGGNSIEVTKFKNINMAIFVCYDLRFGDVFSKIADKVEMMVLIANWPEERADQFDALLRARAIENQAYIIGVNRAGEGNGLRYKHSSTAYDPYGKRITDYNENEILYCSIDENTVKEYREKFQFIKDRKDISKININWYKFTKK